MTLGATGPIASWVQAASQASTLSELQAVQDVSRGLANRIASHDPNLAASLRSSNYQELMHGLASLGRNAEILHHLSSSLDDEAARRLVSEAAALSEEKGGPRDRFVPETAAASQTHTALQYSLSRLRQVGGSNSALLAAARLLSEKLVERPSAVSLLGRAAERLIGRPQERPEASQYDYDISRARGHFFAHEEAPLMATSQEGREFYVRSRREELERLGSYVAAQLDLNSETTRTLYEDLRAKVIENHQPLRKTWDQIVLRMRKMGNIPSFKTVSAAYWRRDEAIRRHPGLRARGFGPREYDLFRMRSDFQAKEVAGTATHRDRVLFYGREFDYALEAISKEYEDLSRRPPSARGNERLRAMEGDRFRMERVFTNLASDKEVSGEDRAFLDGIRARYLPYLESGLAGLNLGEIERLQGLAQAAYTQYSQQMHARHVALAPMMLALFLEEQRRIAAIDLLEEEWQAARYRDLISRRRVTKADFKRFQEALEDYTSTYREYHDHAKKMLEGDPKKREYERNSKYRNVFVSLMNLHETVKKILGENELQILTFAFKNQALLIARGDQGMSGLEPIAETTGRVGPVLKRNEETIYSLHALRQIAGRDWSMGQLSHYARNVHYIGAGKLIGYFAQDIRPETRILEGAAALYPDGFADLKPEDFARRSGVRRALHLGQLEFAEAMGSFYQLGLGHVAILAQAGVGNFPVAGPFLYGLDRDGHHHLGSGALLDRAGGGDKRTHEAFTREFQIGMGNHVNVYDSGTRDIASPIGSPYADFEQYPEAVHLPEYHGTRYNTAMSLRLGKEMGVPVIPVAYDLDRIYCEPSMPMPSNFASNFVSKSPRKIAKRLEKSYGGFWNNRTMLRFVRPGEDDIRVAYGDVITPESMIEVEDLESILEAKDYETIASIEDEKKRDKALRWQSILHNSAAANFYERVAGYMATAGIYGPEARAVSGRDLFASHTTNLVLTH